MLSNFGLNLFNGTFNILLVFQILRNDSVLKFHNKLNDLLKITGTVLLLTCENVVINQNLSEQAVNFEEWLRQLTFELSPIYKLDFVL